MTDIGTGVGDVVGEPRVQRLWLVRHGVTQWNTEQRLCGHSAVELVEAGRVQARWLAERLQQESIRAIYSSDLLRAQQTAEIIAAKTQLISGVYTLPEWRETSFGAWEGLTYAQIAERYVGQRDFFIAPLHYTPPGGEPFVQLVERVQRGFRELAQRAVYAERPGAMVLVSHGGPLRVLLCSLLGMPFERQWQLGLEHGSLSAIDFVPDAEDPAATAIVRVLNVRAGVSLQAQENSLKEPQEYV